MAKINILPAKVYNRIAAGEVVDSPYSVVKELLENSIDAGATEIEIYVEKGGKQLIRVVDNGCGIAREDLHSAFLPHATSKIATAEDLDTIMTLGFRGEAVASIASVSKMTIASKTEEGKRYELTSSGGELGQITEVAGDKGTDVRVEMLFFNAPVRLKFLKSDKAEEGDITNYVSRFILNRSDIAFTYYCDGKKVLQSFGGGMEEAFVSVYGASVVKNCYHIDAERHGVRVRGYIGNQNFYKANKSYQNVFLNGRYIVNTTISAAIGNAYASYLMKRQYPFYVLHIDVPAEVVDVNVHPKKVDVRFADNQIVYGCVYRIISTVLDGHTQALEYIVPDSLPKVQETPVQETLPIIEPKAEKKETPKLRVFDDVIEEEKTGIPAITLPAAKKVTEEKFTYEDAKKEIERLSMKNRTSDYEEMRKGVTTIEEVNEARVKPKRKEEISGMSGLQRAFPELYFAPQELNVGDTPRRPAPVADPFEENKRFLAEEDKKRKQNQIDVTQCVYAGKVFNTYLMYENGTEIYVIDQHAAHERLIYDRLRENMQNRTLTQQPMLVPYTIDVNDFEANFLRERMQDIKDMGIELAEGERNCFMITAIPLELQGISLNTFMHDILADINLYRAIKLEDILKDKLASAACKAAVKAGRDLTGTEVGALFEMMGGNMGLKCPHGRPVVIKITKTELEKMFKRIV